MGGATFPTHVKLAVPPGKRVEYLIINGVECEPYLTSDHRVMLERGEELLVGVAILRKALGVDRAWIGIENNKPDAVARLAELAERHAGIEIVPLRVKYPQGGEKQLIAAVTGARCRRPRCRSTWVRWCVTPRRPWPCTRPCRSANPSSSAWLP